MNKAVIKINKKNFLTKLNNFGQKLEFLQKLLLF